MTEKKGAKPEVAVDRAKTLPSAENEAAAYGVQPAADCAGERHRSVWRKGG